MFWKPKDIPVLIAGMWPSQKDDPESGTRILVQDRERSKSLLQGYSDSNGEFKGTIPICYADKDVRIVMVETGFLFEDYDQVRVNSWGLFLPANLKKDLVFDGHTGAKSIDPEKWKQWNSSEEHAKATQITHSAARKAESVFPNLIIEILIAVVFGIGGFFIHPAVGLIFGVAGAYIYNKFSSNLLVKGY